MMSKSIFYSYHGALRLSILCSTVLKQSMFICMLCHSMYIKLCMCICFIIISVLVLILLRCKLWWRIPFTFFCFDSFSISFFFFFVCFLLLLLVLSCCYWRCCCSCYLQQVLFCCCLVLLWNAINRTLFSYCSDTKKNRHVKRKTKVCNGCKCCTGFNFFHTLFCDFWFVSSTQFFFYFFIIRIRFRLLANRMKEPRVFCYILVIHTYYIHTYV